VSDDRFWVDADGLGRSAEGFHDKAAHVASLANRIKALSDPALDSVVGLDSQGEGIFQMLQRNSGDLHKGISRWRLAIDNTGDSLASSTKIFVKTEDNSQKLSATMAHPALEPEHLVPRTDALVPRTDALVPEADGHVPLEPEHLVPRTDALVPRTDALVPEADGHVPLEPEHFVPRADGQGGPG
jgi:hypothetical protein